MLTGLNYGVLIINIDDDIRKIDFYRFYGKIITFGIKRNADFRAKNIIYSQKGMKLPLFIIISNIVSLYRLGNTML